MNAPNRHRSGRLLGSIVPLIAAVLLMLAMPWAGAAAVAQTLPAANRPAFPDFTLPVNEAAGQRAIDLLGTRLPSVAAFYGKSAEEFRRQLLSDSTLRIDRKGRLFFVEELKKQLRHTTPTAQEGVLDGQLAPLDQTFLLHSKPGANKTIELNFKGAILSGTAWNSTPSSITAPAFDFDGNLASFSDTELQRIQYIWQRVAEDYAPFDVDVTTELVAQDRITRSSNADQIYGTVALVTTRAGVYSCSCGGVAYVGIYNSTSDFLKPALVFYDALGPAAEKSVAEAISHEVGHNIGLYHDGTSTVGYYQGHGSGVTGWAPIMGVGYYQALSQFSKGEYADANNMEDDFAVAQSYGLPLRTDDYGNTAGTAAALGGTSAGGITSASAQGIIERAGDADAFAFSAGPGTLNVSLTPSNRAPNADLALTLLNDAGTTLGTQNPVDALNATLSYQIVTPGTYYLTVKGTGKGNPLTTGYTDYGSAGMYNLAASFTTPGGSATITVSASPPAGGAVTGDGTFPAGSSRTVTATANSGYDFINWTEGGSQVSTLASYTFTLTSNRTLVANFVITPVDYTISLSASPAAGGTYTGGGTFPSGSSRTVTATANSGYDFVNWTEGGSQVSTLASYPFTLTSSRTLVANFVNTPIDYTISLSASPAAGGTYTGGGTFPAGSSRTVTATANSGYDFVDWTEGGSQVSTSASYPFTLTSNRTLVANFVNTPGPEFQVNSYTANSQAAPSVAWLADGGFVVVWRSAGQDGSGNGVYGRRYAASGAVASGEFRVNAYRTSSQAAPSVAGLSGGGFVVTWQSAGQDGSGYGVYGRRYSASGAVASGEFRVNTYRPNSQAAPSVAGLSGGGFVVTWQSAGQDGSGYGVYGQRYTASGIVAGGEFRVNAYRTSSQAVPSVAGLSGGGFVVTWQSAGQDGSGYGVYGRRYTASGAVASGVFRVNAYKTNSQAGAVGGGA